MNWTLKSFFIHLYGIISIIPLVTASKVLEVTVEPYLLDPFRFSQDFELYTPNVQRPFHGTIRSGKTENLPTPREESHFGHDQICGIFHFYWGRTTCPISQDYCPFIDLESEQRHKVICIDSFDNYCGGCFNECDENLCGSVVEECCEGWCTSSLTAEERCDANAIVLADEHCNKTFPLFEESICPRGELDQNCDQDTGAYSEEFAINFCRTYVTNDDANCYENCKANVLDCCSCV